MSAHAPTRSAAIQLSTPGQGELLIGLSGDWLLEEKRPPASDVVARIGSTSPIKRIAFDARELGKWDSGLLTFLARIEETARPAGVDIDHAALPEGARRLIDLAFAVEERAGARRTASHDGFLTRLGKSASESWSSMGATVSFIGEVVLSLGRWLRGRAAYQRADLWVAIQEAGAEALLIVSLISFLVGVILAFVGAVQLQMFGAGIFTANLVGVGMVRELAAIMTGIIMSGRTGASYAAALGTMKVNEEIDAMRTMGIDPIDFLVLPRVLALIVMMPLLSAYANVMGILGGAFVSLGMMDITAFQYAEQTRGAVSMSDFAGGLFKAGIYGALVAIAGCQRGIECGNSASAVGDATTSAVVSGIVMIIVTCAILTVVFTVVGV